MHHIRFCQGLMAFFYTWRTVSGNIDSTTFNSTKRSPNNRKVHRACPAGGSLQVILTKRASPSPSAPANVGTAPVPPGSPRAYTPLANLLHRATATTHPLRHFSVDQAVSAFAFVRPQQHLGVTATIGGLPSSLHQTFQLLTLYPAQSHHINVSSGLIPQGLTTTPAESV